MDDLEILVVEDSPTQAEQLKYILEQNDFPVTIAVNGMEALRILGEHKYSLVLSDIVMPEMDGYDLCSRIKADSSLRDIPVILVTFLSDPTDLVKALECNADGFITKPYDEEFMLSSIQNLRVNPNIFHSFAKEKTLEISVVGEKHYISAGRVQILSLLLSSYGLAIRRNEQLSQAQKELESLSNNLILVNKELEAFSYSVSHDLRAPLRAIAGFAQMLMEDYGEKLDSGGKHQLEVIQDSTRNMQELIEGLLSLSRLGRKEMSLSPIDMEALVREVYDQLLLTEENDDAELKVGELPTVWGDRTMIFQVFANLLSNALKFTRLCKPAVIQVTGSTKGKDNIYSVKDNGAGFDMKYSDKLFRVFHRLHSTEDFEGTGIGLSLVQRIVQRHGGRIWAEGAVGKGAAFHFSLPGEKKEGEDD